MSSFFSKRALNKDSSFPRIDLTFAGAYESQAPYTICVESCGLGSYPTPPPPSLRFLICMRQKGKKRRLWCKELPVQDFFCKQDLFSMVLFEMRQDIWASLSSTATLWPPQRIVISLKCRGVLPKENWNVTENTTVNVDYFGQKQAVLTCLPPFPRLTFFLRSSAPDNGNIWWLYRFIECYDWAVEFGNVVCWYSSSGSQYVERYRISEAIPPVCCHVLQCVAMRCNVLQSASWATRSNSHHTIGVLRCIAVSCSVLQCFAVSYSVLQCLAMSCSVLLQWDAECCSVLQCFTGNKMSNKKIRIYINNCICLFIHIYIHKYINIYVYIQIYTYPKIFMYMYNYICTYEYKFT